MKKGVYMLFSIIITFSLFGCGNSRIDSNMELESNYGNNETEQDYIDSSASQPVEIESSNMDYVTEEGQGVLIVYFSRWGNTEYPSDVDATTSASIVVDDGAYGTTEFLARMIQANVGGEIHLIQTKEKYPVDFDELRDQNHAEMNEEYLPPLLESNLDVSQYDTVFIGYPVWATDVPQAVLSFLNEYDLSGKTVIPFCTHDGYGAGGSYNTIKEASHTDKLLDGLAIEAKDVPNSKDTVDNWLKMIRISGNVENDNESGETAIKITIGDVVLDGVLYDTALAGEIKEYFPLTISMSGYGGREYYGGVDFYPENLEGGQKNIANGDITYCEAHHNMAIFYAQTDNPNLTVDVIPIGRVTSELSVFETFESRESITFSLVE